MTRTIEQIVHDPETLLEEATRHFSRIREKLPPDEEIRSAWTERLVQSVLETRGAAA